MSTNNIDAETETSAITDTEADLLARLAAAATALVNARLGADLAGTDFARSLATGRGSIDLQISLPSGELKCLLRHPDLDASEPVFEVRFTTPHTLLS